ncbi:nucleotide disphospho-sugar-binding domain-containing protein [Spongisporangium articulatum]|uniref:Nucleotide disphospho-sugar-binding domain-containing protein n=1 Tax=Spongisporangium articulatum TaxID=3362603 RepID=A0ABW8ASB0_9ACTN
MEPPRVLAVTLPITGHVMPLTPVLAELVARGSHVDVLAGRRDTRTFADLGLSVHDYPADFDDAVQEPSDNFLRVAADLATWTADPLLGVTLALIDRTRPDVLLVDSMAPWGRVAGSLRRLPVVTSTSSFLVGAGLGADPRALVDGVRQVGRGLPVLRRLGAAVRQVRRAHGVSLGGPLRLLSNRGDATLVYTSAGLQPGGRLDAGVHLVGPTAAQRPGSVPAGSDLAQALDGDNPVGYVSLGTVYWNRPRVLSNAAQALAAAGLRPVVGVGPGLSAADLGKLPPGTIVQHDVPQTAVLERARVFVTHGGLNGVHEALWRAVPLVVVPQAADQPVVGARLSALGAATVVRRPDLATLSAAIRWALAPAARAAARALGDDLRRTGGAGQAADVVFGTWEAFRRRPSPEAT